MELCYQNNPKSLFRKYRGLITSLTKHQLFRDYLSIKGLEIPKKTALLLPNGFIEFDGKQARMTVTPRAPFSPKLYPALQVIDNVQMFLKDFDEATQVLAFQLGLSRNIPDIFKRFHFASLTVNPDADPESTSVDGNIQNHVATTTWATVRNAAAGTAATPSVGSSSTATLINSTTTTNQWQFIDRCAFLYDTSALGAGAIISAAVLSLYGTAMLDELGSQSTCIVTSSPASNTDLVTDDFDQFGTVHQSGDITLASYSTTGYNDYTFNATGRGNVSLTSISKFGQRIVSDADNAEPTWASDKRSSVGVIFSDNGSNQPKLVITYTPLVTIRGYKSLLGVGQA